MANQPLIVSSGMFQYDENGKIPQSSPVFQAIQSSSSSGSGSGSSTTLQAGSFIENDPRPRAPEVWQTTVTGELIPEAPSHYYINIPNSAAAKFSTRHGMLPKRQFGNWLPSRVIQHWSLQQVHEKSMYLRKHFWRDMLKMSRPARWEDLYEYFDAFDLYHQGVYNLWNVIHYTINGNEYWAGPVFQEEKAVIDDWVEKWMTSSTNVEKLSRWDPSTDILSIMDEYDRRVNGVDGDLETRSVAMLRLALEAEYNKLKHDYSQGPYVRPHADGEVGPEDVRNWLRKLMRICVAWKNHC